MLKLQTLHAKEPVQQLKRQKTFYMLQLIIKAPLCEFYPFNLCSPYGRAVQQRPQRCISAWSRSTNPEPFPPNH